jgi:hypothetical protein
LAFRASHGARLVDPGAEARAEAGGSVIGLAVYAGFMLSSLIGQVAYERRGGKSDWKGFVIGWCTGFILLMLVLDLVYWPR